MILLTIAFFAICIGVIVASVRSKRPLKHILAEAKYEIVYNVMGSKSLVEDFLMRKKNKTELPLKTNKVAVITGGTRGIGFEIIRMLLQCDLNVIVGCRNVQLGETLLDKYREEGILTGDIQVFHLDVSSTKSVKSFAETIGQKYPKIHILINNAGIMYVPYRETVEGFESQFATNYLGHFLLTHLLLKQLKEAGEESANSRVVNVTSCAHESGRIDFEDINCKDEYIAFRAYAQSKLAQLLFSNYLNKLMEKEGNFVRSYAVHPGVVNTGLFNDTYVQRIAPWVPKLFFKAPAKGAIPIVCAAVSPKLEGKGGSYISNCRKRKPSNLALSRELQEKVFVFTKDLLKIEEFGKE